MSFAREQSVSIFRISFAQSSAANRAEHGYALQVADSKRRSEELNAKLAEAVSWRPLCADQGMLGGAMCARGREQPELRLAKQRKGKHWP